MQNTLAARAGRWSAQHRKRAILGWILFVVLATVAGGAVGVRNLADEDTGNGESRAADQAVAAAGFPKEAGEQVLVTGPRAGGATATPASRAPSATSCAGSSARRTSRRSRRPTPRATRASSRATAAPRS